MVRDIVIYPDKRLKTPSVEVGDEDADKIIQDMIDTMNAYKGCVGISAVQIGELKRIIVVNVEGHRKAKTSHGLIVLINPIIKTKKGKVQYREGCLSIPEFTANVMRSNSIRVEGINRNGKRIEIATSGFEAVVLQHEIDHLDGILFLDRVSSPSSIYIRKGSM